MGADGSVETVVSGVDSWWCGDRWECGAVGGAGTCNVGKMGDWNSWDLGTVVYPHLYLCTSSLPVTHTNMCIPV